MSQITFTPSSNSSLSSSTPSHVDLLVLGAGWLSQFLLPLLVSRNISYSATTRTGESHYPDLPSSSPLLKFAYDPKASVDEVASLFSSLPRAKTVLVTFPIVEPGANKVLVEGYLAAGKAKEQEVEETLWIRLGSTGIWSADALQSSAQIFDRHSPVPPSNARGVNEIEFLELDLPKTTTTVLNLAGLWGGERMAKNWVSKVAPNKETLKNKGSLHMIHGHDISLSLVSLHLSPHLLPPLASHPSSSSARRFILTDTRLYDWWDLASSWGQDGQAQWVRELMREQGVVSLPRSKEELGRVLDSREFWDLFGSNEKGEGFRRLE